jgi:hypothetical protein
MRSRSGRVSAAVALAALLGALLAASPAGAAIPRGRQAIGDSVMLGAADALRGRGIRVNAVVSRQFRDAVGLVRRLRAEGRLRRVVIIHLGHNGILIDQDDCDRIAELAGGRRTVHLLTLKIPRWYRETQNRRLAACASRHANTRLLDWFAHSHDHPGWFADDGYHLTPRGRARYAAFVDARTA